MVHSSQSGNLVSQKKQLLLSEGVVTKTEIAVNGYFNTLSFAIRKCCPVYIHVSPQLVFHLTDETTEALRSGEMLPWQGLCPASKVLAFPPEVDFIAALHINGLGPQGLPMAYKTGRLRGPNWISQLRIWFCAFQVQAGRPVPISLSNKVL